MSDLPRPELQTWFTRRWPRARLIALAGDASARRFFRVALDAGASHVLMDYGAPFDRETDDVRLRRIFEDAGLPAARIVDVVPDPGCLVLEDLGDRTVERAWNETPAKRRALLDQAVTLAVRIATDGTPALARSERAGGPTLDADRFFFEMDFFAENYVEGYLARRLPEELRRELHVLAKAAADTPRRVLCHRDYHSRNLMVTDGGELAMVDIQDARWGPDTYDIASLLNDAYIDLDPELRSTAFESFRAALDPRPPAAELRRRFEIVAAERMIKALGTFGYQIAVLGKTFYRAAIPRTVERLDVLLPELGDLPRLADLREFLR